MTSLPVLKTEATKCLNGGILHMEMPPFLFELRPSPLALSLVHRPQIIERVYVLSLRIRAASVRWRGIEALFLKNRNEQMRSGLEAGWADGAEQCSFRNLLSVRDGKRAEVREYEYKVMDGIVERNVFSKSDVRTVCVLVHDGEDRAVGRRIDRRAEARGKVDAIMPAIDVKVGIRGTAVSLGDIIPSGAARVKEIKIDVGKAACGIVVAGIATRGSDAREQLCERARAQRMCRGRNDVVADRDHKDHEKNKGDTLKHDGDIITYIMALGNRVFPKTLYVVQYTFCVGYTALSALTLI